MQAVSAFNEVSRWTVFELHSNPVVLSNTRPLAQLEKIVELLLAHGADPYAKDSEGNDVFHQKRFSNHMPRSLERFAR
jgi:ankyrin repeat protein